jgi:hypothetical protein
MTEIIDTILSSKSTKKIKPQRDFKDIDAVFENDLVYINTKLTSLENHVSQLDNIIEQLQISIRNETDRGKKINFYKAINSNLKLIAELSDIIQKFATIKFKYRTEQSASIHRQKLLELRGDMSTSNVTVSDLMQILKSFPTDKQGHGDETNTNKYQRVYQEIQDDLSSETYKMN